MFQRQASTKNYKNREYIKLVIKSDFYQKVLNFVSDLFYLNCNKYAKKYLNLAIYQI